MKIGKVEITFHNAWICFTPLGQKIKAFNLFSVCYDNNALSIVVINFVIQFNW